MARLNVNPTRMEMKRLQSRLKTATRGHKLLKDKTDEMVRRFISIAQQNKLLREEVEQDLANAMGSFAQARTQSHCGRSHLHAISLGNFAMLQAQSDGHRRSAN